MVRIYQKPFFLRVTNTGYKWGRDYPFHDTTRKPNEINGFVTAFAQLK
jgi:hypothetical protein